MSTLPVIKERGTFPEKAGRNRVSQWRSVLSGMHDPDDVVKLRVSDSRERNRVTAHIHAAARSLGVKAETTYLDGWLYVRVRNEEEEEGDA
jgi:hypothetical protein